MSNLRYPDAGERYEDANMLRNAVLFTTTQRARAASRILDEPFDEHDEIDRAATAVDAFRSWIESTEDTLGWLFALNEWEPGKVENCLFLLLDRIQVGRSPWSETDALTLLEDLGSEGFRARIAHLPSDDELRSAGWSDEMVGKVREAVSAQLAGFTNVAELRARKERAFVRAYNKSKHQLLAMLGLRDGKLEVDLMTVENRGGDFATEGVVLGGAEIATDQKTTVERASAAITMQAVLSAMLIAILDVRFGVQIDLPAWATASLGLPGWRKDEQDGAAESDG